MGNYIHILDEGEEFEWRPVGDDGQPMDSVFMLRQLSDDEMKALRKKHNHLSFKHGQRVDEFDSFGFTDDLVDKAIVSWRGVRRRGSPEELPCERAVKCRLPDKWKTEIVRLCGGKEAGLLAGEEAAASKKP